jgi:hypothetical protein
VKAEAGKLPGAGIIPKLCPRKGGRKRNMARITRHTWRPSPRWQVRLRQDDGNRSLGIIARVTRRVVNSVHWRTDAYRPPHNHKSSCNVSMPSGNPSKAIT